MFPGNYLPPPPRRMRVLAVDGNQTSLILLANMLHACHYDVTATTQSTQALDMLRRQRNYFDLVICDVNMPLPGMDGFDLLRQVQLEMMNLPVVMLSEYSDTELVTRSILGGACYYLSKPVRIEELRNIWQHVLRRNIWQPVPRRNIYCNSQNKTINEEKICNMAGEGTQAIMVPENNDVQNNVLGQKRKEQRDEYGQENEESSSGNIGQHVVSKKVDCIDLNKALNEEKICNVAGEGTKGIVPENNDVQNNVLGQKRKEQRDESGQENEESSSGNIGQHVVSKNVDCIDLNKALNKEKICNVAGEGTKGMVPENNDVQNNVFGQKSKEQSAENGQENEEPSSGNKHRLTWTAELHGLFVAAIDQLGLENATGKTILDLMNVEGVSTTHVSSHLQKYRLKLGRKKPTKQAKTSMANPASNLSGSSSLVHSPPSICNVNQSTSESQSSDFPATSSTSTSTTVVGHSQDAVEKQ